MKTLMAVARHGSFASAGAHIGLTQSAVSAQIQRLEAELGFALFDRTGRSARLNAQGQHTLERAEAILQLVGDLGAVPDAAATGGKVAVGAIESVQTRPLIDALARFHAAHPGSKTRVVPGVSLQLLGLVDSGEVDFGVMIRPPFELPKEIDWQVLERQRFVLIARDTVTGGDWRTILATQPFVRYDRASFGGRLVEQFLKRQRLQVLDTVEIDDQDAMAELVARGVGVALVPRSDLFPARWPQGLRVIELGDGEFHREIGMAWRKDRARRFHAQALARCLEEAFRPAAGAA